MANAWLDPYDCDCGWLARVADNPVMSIGFDPETNEYYMEIRGAGQVEGRMIIRFCPSCGGDAPVSKREELFHPVAAEDQVQIHQFNEELRTKAQVLAKWGKPDEEVRGGYGIPESHHEGARMVMFDVLRYNNILRSAIVDVIVRHDDTVSVSYMPKARVTHEG